MTELLIPRPRAGDVSFAAPESEMTPGRSMRECRDQGSRIGARHLDARLQIGWRGWFDN
jgi:hypothetical protein